MGDKMELDTNLTIRLDRRTVDFLEALRDHEHINISAWVREAIRAKAGLKPEKQTKRT